jgi:prepilin-type N-terminal cleavage/methylation domain-containing protein
MRRNKPSAFTLIELLVVIAIIAVLASFAVPAITSALTKGQLVGTVNNARQFFLAGYQMALDGNTNSDVNYNWPGDYNTPAITKLSDYCTKLVANQYLKTGDLAKLLSGPGAIVGATGGVTDPTTGVTSAVVLTGTTPGLKVYELRDGDSANTIFAVSNNYTYNTALTPTVSPYGDKGFVVIRKGGDCLSLRKNNALAASYPNVAAFQSAVGKLTGDADGTLGTEGSTLVLAFP